MRKSFHRGLPPRRRTIEVLKGADLEIGAGELVGLVGENGSGKSTLMQIVVGLLSRDGGEIERPGKLGYCPPASNDLSRGWCRLMGLTPIALFAASVFVARNLRVADAFAARQIEEERRAANGLPPKRRRRRRQTAEDLGGAANAPP